MNSGFFYSSAEQRERLVRAERQVTNDRVQKVIDLKNKVLLWPGQPLHQSKSFRFLHRIQTHKALQVYVHVGYVYSTSVCDLAALHRARCCSVSFANSDTMALLSQLAVLCHSHVQPRHRAIYPAAEHPAAEFAARLPAVANVVGWIRILIVRAGVPYRCRL